MGGDGFRLWYKAKRAADTAPVEIPVAAKVLTEWASKTEAVPEKRKRGRPPKHRAIETVQRVDS